MSSSVHVTAEESKCDQADDIDAVYSAVGRFVRGQRTVTSSIIGSHSVVCTSPHLVQVSDSDPLNSQKSSANVSNDASASSTVRNTVECEKVGCSLSSCASVNSSIGGNKTVRHSAG